jgi:hypothetical protein
MSDLYLQIAARLDWLLQPLEEALLALPQDAVIDRNFVQTLSLRQRPSHQETLAAYEALVSLGVLHRTRSSFQLNHRALQNQVGYCRGVREALNFQRSQSSDAIKLCVALPIGLDDLIAQELRRYTVDMRASLFDLIAATKSRIVLASPFWDAETANEIAELLVRRLEDNVSVEILGRFEKGDDEGRRVLQQRLSPYARCRILAWYKPDGQDRWRSQTFHFKAAVSDEGEKAYLGSANLTTSSLRSRMELGTILTGENAMRLEKILGIVLQLARDI